MRSRWYLDEDNGRANGHQTVQLDEHVIFGFLRVAVEVQLFDAFDGEFFVLESDLVGVRGELRGEAHDAFGEGGREQDDLSRLGESAVNRSSVGEVGFEA